MAVSQAVFKCHKPSAQTAFKPFETYSHSGAGGVIDGVFGTPLCSLVDGLYVFSCFLSLA